MSCQRARCEKRPLSKTRQNARTARPGRRAVTPCAAAPPGAGGPVGAPQAYNHANPRRADETPPRRRASRVVFVGGAGIGRSKGPCGLAGSFGGRGSAGKRRDLLRCPAGCSSDSDVTGRMLFQT